jgi:hypothetical protein
MRTRRSGRREHGSGETTPLVGGEPYARKRAVRHVAATRVRVEHVNARRGLAKRAGEKIAHADLLFRISTISIPRHAFINFFLIAYSRVLNPFASSTTRGPVVFPRTGS